MKVGALFSGGKDSTYAAYLASRENELSCLVTVLPASESSYMFHYPDLKWTRLQAEAAGLPQLFQETQGVKEEELNDLAAVVAKAKKTYGLEAICSGAMASRYQKERVEKVCREAGLACLSPLWGVDPERHLGSLLRDRFVAIVVSVSALGLDRSWLGRELDQAAVDELVALSRKYKFHAGLEGGEGETFVLDCPLFKAAIEVLGSTTRWRGDSGVYEIGDARLVAKPT